METERTFILEFKWTTSRARDTYGYNVVSLFVNNTLVARANGGGYDLRGTVFGDWIALTFREELLSLDYTHVAYPQNGGKRPGFYGLTFHDPNFDPGKAVVNEAPPFGDAADVGKTVEQLEQEGKSLGLERYQQFYRASSPVPTPRHTVPQIDGAVGFSTVQRILTALGYTLEYITDSKNLDVYVARSTKSAVVEAGSQGGVG